MVCAKGPRVFEGIPVTEDETLRVSYLTYVFGLNEHRCELNRRHVPVVFLGRREIRPLISVQHQSGRKGKHYFDAFVWELQRVDAPTLRVYTNHDWMIGRVERQTRIISTERPYAFTDGLSYLLNEQLLKKDTYMKGLEVGHGTPEHGELTKHDPLLCSAKGLDCNVGRNRSSGDLRDCDLPAPRLDQPDPRGHDSRCFGFKVGEAPLKERWVDRRALQKRSIVESSFPCELLRACTERRICRFIKRPDMAGRIGKPIQIELRDVVMLLLV